MFRWIQFNRRATTYQCRLPIFICVCTSYNDIVILVISAGRLHTHKCFPRSLFGALVMSWSLFWCGKKRGNTGVCFDCYNSNYSNECSFFRCTKTSVRSARYICTESIIIQTFECVLCPVFVWIFLCVDHVEIHNEKNLLFLESLLFWYGKQHNAFVETPYLFFSLILIQDYVTKIKI